MKTVEYKKGYKKTTLGWIPNDWEIKKLKDLGKIFIGLTYKPEDVVEENVGTLVLRSSNIQDSNLSFKDNIFVKTIIPERAFVKEGDILICVRNGSRSLIGKSVRITKKCNGMAYGAFMSIIRSEENDFLIHLFQSGYFQNDIYKNLGATINQITSEQLYNFKFALPPHLERIRISTLLNSWTKSIENIQRLIEKKVERKKALMQQLLTGKKRLKGFNRKWNKSKMGDLFEQIRSTNNGNKIDVYTISSRLGFVTQHDKFNKVIAGSSLDKYVLIKANDFSYNKGNSLTYPYGCIFKFENSTGLVPFVSISFKHKKELNTDFYKYYFEFGLLERQLKKIITSGARGDGLLNVSPDDFFKLDIEEPPIKEQSAISNILLASDKEIELLKQKFELLKKQKQGLMQVLLTGKVRVSK